MVLTWDPEAPVMPRSCEGAPSGGASLGALFLGPEAGSVPWAGQRWDRGDGDGQAGHTQPGASCPWAALPGL